MSDASRSARAGLEAGLVAGVLFAGAQTIAAAATADDPLLPLRMFASVALGPDVLERAPPLVLVAGGVVHVALSSAFGLVYGLGASALTAETRRSAARQSLIGTGFGVALWLVDFQLLARVWFPWFLALPPGPVLVLHALGYGLPLGLVYAALERRVPPVQSPLAYGP